MTAIHTNNGIQKPRGLDNAELQHLKHGKETNQSAHTETQQTLSDHESPLFNSVDTVELGNSRSITHFLYSSPLLVKTNLASDKTDPVNLQAAKVTIDLENGNDSNQIHNSNDLLIIGNGAKVEWNSSVGIDNGNDTVIIGNGAKVKMNSTGGTDNGNEILIIGKDADIGMMGNLGIDNSKDGGITFLDGKLHIHLINEKNQTFQIEVNVKNKEEATSIQDFIRIKFKQGKIHGEDLSNIIQEIQERAWEVKNKKNEKFDDLQIKKQEDLKPINKHQHRLEMMQSLVQNLLLYQNQVKQGLHKGFVHRKDEKI